MKTIRESYYQLLGWYQAYCRGIEQAVLAQAQRLLDEGASEDAVKSFYESHGFLKADGEQK